MSIFRYGQTRTPGINPVLRFASTAVLLACIHGCAGDPDSRPRWVEAADVDIAAFATFDWANGRTAPPVSIIDRQIRDAIRGELLSRGYRESSDAPDLLVDHETIEEDAVEQGNPVRIGIGVGSWGRNVGGSVGTSVDVGEKDRVVQQLRINIRVVERAEDREVWNGTTPPMEAQPGKEKIERAISGLMGEFPAKRS